MPHAGGRVPGVAGFAGPGAGRARDLGPAPRQAAGARRADAPQPRRGGKGGPGRRQRARGGVGGGRQLGHGLGAARADAGDRGAGRHDRRAAAVRPGAGRDRVRSGADRPAAAASDQQGRHAGLSRPVRAGVRRGRAGPAPRRPGRHGDPAGSGAQRPGPAALRDRALGRGAGRGEGPAREPEGTRRGLLRSRHRRRDLLPSRRDRPRRAATSPRPARTPSGSDAGLSARWRWPAAWTASRTARCRRRWPR